MFFVILYSCSQGIATNVVGEVIEGTPAYDAGIMANDKIIFEKSPYFAKLMLGSTCENIGPILLKQAVTAEKFVPIENPSKETTAKLVE